MSNLIHIVHEVDHLKEIVELQRLVWGNESISSMVQMMAAIHHGGAVFAAFDNGKIVGFNYGFPGFSKGQTYLFSHMMAIHPEYRDSGVGRELKERQREWAITQGYAKIAWTFDPLETRNGYLNLNKLGGYVQVYVNNYYGNSTDPLNLNIPSDRFLIEWELNSSRCLKALQGEVPEERAWLNYVKLSSWQLEEGLPKPVFESRRQESEDGWLIPVPKSILAIKQANLELAKLWRLAIREHITQKLAEGYRVVGLLRTEDEPVHYYVLEKS